MLSYLYMHITLVSNSNSSHTQTEIFWYKPKFYQIKNLKKHRSVEVGWKRIELGLMGRPPCCNKISVKKGSWTPEEDIILVSYVQEHGPGNWRAVPATTCLRRCSKSCRLRWTNYLRPGIKRGSFTDQEEKMIIQLQALLGNKWAAIASYLPGRTDNDIKNYWKTHLKKKLKKLQSGPLDQPKSNDPISSIPRGQWEKRHKIISPPPNKPSTPHYLPIKSRPIPATLRRKTPTPPASTLRAPRTLQDCSKIGCTTLPNRTQAQTRARMSSQRHSTRSPTRTLRPPESCRRPLSRYLVQIATSFRNRVRLEGLKLSRVMIRRCRCWRIG